MAENNRLSKIISKQQEEIEELKRKLKYQDEFIELLFEKEDTREVREIDVEELQGKRYLFVGRIDEALPQLKHFFPNSIFMNTETTNISNIKVDAIVMLIKYMSHSMFYKVKSANYEVPVIMCNTKNIDLIYEDMYRAIDES